MTAAAIDARPRRLHAPMIFGTAILALMIIVALVPQHVAPYDPMRFDYHATLAPPSLAHLFGTDMYGRDILSRTLWATRIDLQIAIFSTLAPVIIGTLIGTLIGYYGGLADIVFNRLVDVVVTFPFLVLVIGIVAILGPGLTNLYIAIGLVDWVFFARLARAEILVQRRLDYAYAARGLGYGPLRIIFRHLLPNAIGPIITYWMTDMALAILLGSSLGYLGLGAQPPLAEWGTLIADGKNFMATAWWITIFPGLAIVIAGFGFSLAGDGLADLLRVRE
jgi:peptide/nickel transport system permease protein